MQGIHGQFDGLNSFRNHEHNFHYLGLL